MSAAKMVADSTQSDIAGDQSEARRNKRRREKKLRRDSRKLRASVPGNSSGEECGSASDGMDSDTDLRKELKPLHVYLGDRPALLDQMLHSVRGSSLQRALPAKLRDMPMEELRRRCLEQLLVMSKKRIGRIMAGDDPATISSSGTEDETSQDEERECGRSGDTETGKVDSTSGAERSRPGADTGSREGAGAGVGAHSARGVEEPALSLDDDADLMDDDVGAGRAGRTWPEDDDDGDGGEVRGDGEGEMEEWGVAEGREDVVKQVLFPEVEQDRMELLELEMRARAIKAMLALHEQRERRT